MRRRRIHVSAHRAQSTLLSSHRLIMGLVIGERWQYRSLWPEFSTPLLPLVPSPSLSLPFPEGAK
jgi:hypothetical protein